MASPTWIVLSKCETSVRAEHQTVGQAPIWNGKSAEARLFHVEQVFRSHSELVKA